MFRLISHRTLCVCLVLALLSAVGASSRLPLTHAAETAAVPKVKHVIDTHIHLYDPTRKEGVPWPPKSDKVLHKPHLPPEFARVAKPAGVTGVVIVEASDWLADNDWVLKQVDGDDFYVGLVARLDITDKNFPEQLAKLAKHPNVVGVRARVAEQVDFDSDVIVANAKAMADAGLTLDILPHNTTVADCDKLARAVPNLRIVVNHALAYPADGKEISADYIKQVQQLAKNRNVYCKISGLYQHSAKQPAPTQIAHYKSLLDVLWDAFGEKRLIYGSNWPVTKHSGDYASYMALVNSYFEPKGKAASERYFWKNAAKAYRLKFK